MNVRKHSVTEIAIAIRMTDNRHVSGTSLTAKAPLHGSGHVSDQRTSVMRKQGLIPAHAPAFSTRQHKSSRDHERILALAFWVHPKGSILRKGEIRL
jgi:hypothetical protein